MVESYLNDPELTFERSEDGFPSRDRLSGEYYVSGDDYWIERCQGRERYGLHVMARCLEPLSDRNHEDRDYLGLELRAWLWADSRELEYDDGLNSSVI